MLQFKCTSAIIAPLNNGGRGGANGGANCTNNIIAGLLRNSMRQRKQRKDIY